MTKIVIMRRVPAQTSTAHQVTSHLTKARIVIKIKRKRKTSTRVPVLRRRIKRSIPAVPAVNIRAKTRIETVNVRKIKTDIKVAVQAQNIRVETRIVNEISTRVAQVAQKINHHRSITARIMISKSKLKRSLKSRRSMSHHATLICHKIAHAITRCRSSKMKITRCL